MFGKGFLSLKSSSLPVLLGAAIATALIFHGLSDALLAQTSFPSPEPTIEAPNTPTPTVTPTATPTATNTPTPTTIPPANAGVCGDGALDPGEECDDGNRIHDDACSIVCKKNFCGDHKVNNGEQCDDGNTVSDDGCSKECKKESCGDGIVQAARGEECDDGNRNHTDACTNMCKRPFCGDNIKQQGEECDDGNKDNNDSCSNACKDNGECGDGIVQAPRENCELKPQGKPPGWQWNSPIFDCQNCRLKAKKRERKRKAPGAQGKEQGAGVGGGGGGGNQQGGGFDPGFLLGGLGGNFPFSISPQQLPSVQGMLDFSDPITIGSITVSCGSGQVSTNDGTSYNANVAVAVNRDGEIGISGNYSDGEKDLYINGDSRNQFYTVQEFDSSKVKIDPKKPPERNAAYRKAVARQQKSSKRKVRRTKASTSASTDRSCGSSIKILFGYTEELLEERGEAQIAAAAGKAFCDARVVAKNSGIPVTFEPVGLAKVKGNTSQAAPEALAQLADPAGPFSKLHAARFKAKADLVSLIVPGLAGYCGYAQISGTPGISNLQKAFSVLAQNCLAGSHHTLIHEIGHNLGMHHNVEDANGPGARPWAYGYRDEVHRSVMSYPKGSSKLQPYFSDPNQFVDGRALGTTGSADNAAVSAESAPIVACYGENLR
ncbi:MAG: DUF4215 domain-containing protein [Deltaproteobacteria bacterium]|nr:DUF4215 domain-containing protein [Deltaproteobacteria bacterium]